MTTQPTNLQKTTPVPSETSFQTAWIVVLSIIAGVMLAVVILPAWLPNLVSSLLGPEPKAFWYLSRAAAITAYGLLWVSMATGVAITNKMAAVWPGGPTARDLHQFTSLLGLGFALFHGVILIGDAYINFNLVQVLLPFSSPSYRPFWVGVGQTTLYLWAIVAFSFYLPRQIKQRVWRKLHFVSFAVFAAALLHGITSGTDSGTTWMSGLYWVSGSILVFLTFYRVIRTAKQAEI